MERSTAREASKESDGTMKRRTDRDSQAHDADDVFLRADDADEDARTKMRD